MLADMRRLTNMRCLPYGHLRLLCLATLAVGLVTPARANANSTGTARSAIAQGESIVLAPGEGQYFYVGSTAGGKPMGSISWSPDLSATASYSGNEAISIGRSTSNSGSYSSLTGTDAIAGASLIGYTVKEVFRKSVSAVGPGYSGGPETSAAGESLELPFTTQSGDLVLILAGGQGTGDLQLSGIAAEPLQNKTYSAGSQVLASAAIYEAVLSGGNYTAHWTSTTYLTNSGTSLGAVVYVLEPTVRIVLPVEPGPGTPSSSPVSTGHSTPTPGSRSGSRSPALLSAFSPLFATRADLTGRTLGLLVGIPAIGGAPAGSTITVRCRHACAYALRIVRHVGKHSQPPIRLPRTLVLHSGTIVEISVSQPGHTGRYAEYRFRRTRQGVVAYATNRGCLGANDAHQACV